MSNFYFNSKPTAAEEARVAAEGGRTLHIKGDHLVLDPRATDKPQFVEVDGLVMVEFKP